MKKSRTINFFYIDGRLLLGFVMIAMGVCLTTAYTEENYTVVYKAAFEKLSDIVNLDSIKDYSKCIFLFNGYLYIVGGSMMLLGGWWASILVSTATLIQALTIDNFFLYSSQSDKILRFVFMLFHVVVLSGAFLGTWKPKLEMPSAPKKSKGVKYKFQ